MLRILRFLAVACTAALFVQGCTITRSERSTLSGPSEMALSLSISANPDVMPAGGTSNIVVQARDANGQAVKSLPLHFDIAITPSSLPTGTFTPTPPPGQTPATTDSDGRATATYTAPNSTVDALVTIAVTPIGSDYSNAVARTVTIRVVPGS